MMNVESYKPFFVVDQLNEAYQSWPVSEVKQLQERSDRHFNLADCFPIVVADMLTGDLEPILMQLLHLCMSACQETWHLLLPVFV